MRGRPLRLVCAIIRRERPISDSSGVGAPARRSYVRRRRHVEAEVTEYQSPGLGQPGRVAWHGWSGGGADTRLDVHHAWLVENLDGGRVRILTQETQNGEPAKELAAAVPNPMINGHQEWIVGLAKAALARTPI